MKKTVFGWEDIKCPECEREQQYPPNAYVAYCTCGSKYIGRGKWLTAMEQINEDSTSTT